MTCTDDGAEAPPAPVQTSENVVETVSGPTLTVPEVGRAPGQLAEPPEAVHAVALLDAQLSVVLPPDEILVGLAVKLVMLAAGSALTVTVADRVTSVVPTQRSVYVVVAVGVTVSVPPVALLLPVHPPLAVQALAWLAFQVSVAFPPVVIAVGAAVSERVVGAGGASTCTVTDCAGESPPGPEHTSVNVETAVSALVCSVPDVGLAPDQPPDAVQEVALVVDQVSVLLRPEEITGGLAASVTSGSGDPCVTVTATRS